MGNYREQYERYYGGIGRKSTNNRLNLQGYSKKPQNKVDKNYGLAERWTKKLLYQLVGALLLICLILTIKMIPLQQTKAVYNETKELMDEKINIKDAIMSINIPDTEEYKERILDYIDEINSAVNGEKTLKEKIKDNYIVPVSGIVTKSQESSNSIDIITEGENDILSVYDGIVEESVDEGENKYLLINHDNGVESYYGLLSVINVKKGDKVAKGQVIGKAGNVDSDKKKGIEFKMIYMGNEKSPGDLLDLSSLKEA
ncbi:MAG: M23 family metallopeptidase [Clostridiaceae bacterium]|nr:M23 family metallopeptidase [Clostridiaceae bacterium]